jgi:ATP-dependent DNA helicase RecG
MLDEINEQWVLQKTWQGEDSQTQFKAEIDSDSLAAEMVAFSNAYGGHLLIGIDKHGQVKGLSFEQIEQLNQTISNTAHQKVQPPILPLTKIVTIEEKSVLIVFISKGTSGPYCTNKGVYWMKNGADKARSSREELMRSFRESGAFSADELPVAQTDCYTDLDRAYFYTFFEREYRQDYQQTGLSLEKLLENMGLAQDSTFTLGGLLLFGQHPERFRPAFHIKAVSFYGNDITDTRYVSSINIEGKLEIQFRGAMNFLKTQLNYVQNDKNFNSTGDLEIPETALEEAIQNALFHRDYTKNAAIRLLIFKDWVEIISPGKLPNHLTVERIKNGNSVIRNNVLVSFGGKVIPYRGLGVRRILALHPATEFINEVDGEQFIVKLYRKLNP